MENPEGERLASELGNAIKNHLKFFEWRADKFDYLRLPADLERFVSKTRRSNRRTGTGVCDKILTWWKKERKLTDKERTDEYIRSKTNELRESQKKYLQAEGDDLSAREYLELCDAIPEIFDCEKNFDFEPNDPWWDEKEEIIQLASRTAGSAKRMIDDKKIPPAADAGKMAKVCESQKARKLLKFLGIVRPEGKNDPDRNGWEGYMAYM